MNDPSKLIGPIINLSFACIAFGTLGMAMSFLYLASWSSADTLAGTSGFVAGAILIGAGLVSCAVLASSSRGAGSS